MLRVLAGICPEVRDTYFSGEDCRNQKSFIDLRHEVLLKQFDFLGIGEVVLDHALPGAAVVGFRHISGRCLIAEALSGADQTLD